MLLCNFYFCFAFLQAAEQKPKGEGLVLQNYSLYLAVHSSHSCINQLWLPHTNLQLHTRLHTDPEGVTVRHIYAQLLQGFFPEHNQAHISANTVECNAKWCLVCPQH